MPYLWLAFLYMSRMQGVKEPLHRPAIRESGRMIMQPLLNAFPLAKISLNKPAQVESVSELPRQSLAMTTVSLER